MNEPQGFGIRRRHPGGTQPEPAVRLPLIARLLTPLFALVLTATLGGCSGDDAPSVPPEDSPSASSAPVDDGRQPLFEGLGAVDFPIATTSPEAQRYFDQGLALAWAFNHAAADLAFTEATVSDPDCAMCYWGSAYVLGPNLNAPMMPDNAPRARVLVDRALELVDGVSEKERALIEALSVRYVAEPPADRTALDVAFADAMARVADRFRNDATIAAIAAEAAMDLHPWDFWLADGTPRPWTTRITDRIEHALALDPDHPGAIHLYIHAVEASRTAARAEPYADKLADLAPTAGHLVHMPAHIYIRTGRYHDSTLNNQKATDADAWFTSACHTNSFIYLGGYVPHNWHFGAITAGLEGWSEKAFELATGTRNAITPQMLATPGFSGSAQHFVAQPLYLGVRFGAWDSILAEPSPAPDLAYVNAVWHYARGRALIGTDDLEGAHAEADALDALRESDGIAGLGNVGRNSAATVLELAALVLRGEMAAAEGDHDAAIALLDRAVAIEDELLYTEPPDWFYPARHSLGAVQLAAGRPDAAEATYRADLAVLPENGWALKGLERALTDQGREDEAAEIEARFAKAWAHADVAIEGSRI